MSVAYSADGSRIVSGSWDNTVRIWNSQNGQLVSGPFTHLDDVHSVAFSPDGTRVVSGSKDKTLRIWDAESGKTNSRPELARDVKSVRFSPDGSHIISDDGTTWHVEDREIVSEGSNERESRTLEMTDGMQFNFEGYFEWYPYDSNATLLHRGWGHPCQVAVSPNGKRFAITYSDRGSIRVWDQESDKLVCGPFDGQGGWIYSLAFSPDGRHIASGSNSIRVWDVETGRLLLRLSSAHTRMDIYAVAYSLDGRHITSGSNDKIVRVWDVETRRHEILEGHSVGVRSVSFSSDGSQIFSSCENSEIRVWSTSTLGALRLMD